METGGVEAVSLIHFDDSSEYKKLVPASDSFLTTYQVLPPDFVLEIHHLEDGRIETNRIGIPHAHVTLMSYYGLTIQDYGNARAVLAESFFGDVCTFLRDAGHPKIADKFRKLYAEKKAASQKV